MRRISSLVALGIGLALEACATMPPEEKAVRELMWDAATKCASGTATITVTQVDSFGRVWMCRLLRVDSRMCPSSTAATRRERAQS